MRRTARAAAVLTLCLATPGCVGDAGYHWFAAGRRAAAEAPAPQPGEDARHARNAILFIGDGMGISTVTAARILEGQMRGEPGEENLLAFERLPYVALVKTYNTNQQVPDSAGTMTAMVTGEKTRAYVLAVDQTVERGDFAASEGHRLTTILEQAEDRGLSTGVVTTTSVTHATPAACYAHSPERHWEDDSELSPAARRADFPDIARQLVEFQRGDGIDVILGGGREHLLPESETDPEQPELRGARKDGRNLIREWLARHPKSTYVWNRRDFEGVDPGTTDHLMGLFAPDSMAFEVDRASDPGGEPSLAEMTVKALEILERNPKGYFLMVEGGRIDHGHHLGNAYRALTETIAFSQAVQAALDRIDLAETLVVVTADHGHVMTIGGFPTRGNPILGKVMENDARGRPAGRFALDALGLPYTTLGYQNGPGVPGYEAPDKEGHFHHPAPAPAAAGKLGGRPDLTDVDTADPDYLQEAAVPLRSETHSGEDVPVYAGGAGAFRIHGVQEQSYVYHAIAAALGWSQPPGLLERILH